jgi:hypothetical protein
MNDWYRDGAQAEYCAARAVDVTPKPRSLDHVAAGIAHLRAYGLAGVDRARQTFVRRARTDSRRGGCRGWVCCPTGAMVWRACDWHLLAAQPLIWHNVHSRHWVAASGHCPVQFAQSRLRVMAERLPLRQSIAAMQRKTLRPRSPGAGTARGYFRSQIHDAVPKQFSSSSMRGCQTTQAAYYSAG